ncbi:MAG TPA: tRNA adenosine deaminase-associated protein [Streptosporangiaceae bacterium]|nr:tRNA adenosine deaminase-associated protein [Streptosporangiaceae bacterium]
MPYFAAVFARTEAGWIGADADLSEILSLDDAADLMRETAVEAIGDLVLMLIEEDDTWFGVVRLDGDDEPRVFLSDPEAGRNSKVAAFLVEPLGEISDGEPAGELALLDDLGTAADRLVELSDRALPGDALTIVAEQAGFVDEFDRLR